MSFDLIIRPNRFFKNVRQRKVSLFAPILILFLTGVFDGVISSLAINHTTLSDVIYGWFPITKFLVFLIGSNLSFYLLIAAQTFLFHLIIIKLGGEGATRRKAFYILGLATLPSLIQSIIHLFFPQTILWLHFENYRFLYLLIYNFLNIFNIWGVALLIIGFAKVYNVSYKKSSILYLQFLIKIIPLFLIAMLVG